MVSSTCEHLWSSSLSINLRMAKPQRIAVKRAPAKKILRKTQYFRQPAQQMPCKKQYFRPPAQKIPCKTQCFRPPTQKMPCKTQCFRASQLKQICARLITLDLASSKNTV